MVSPKRDNKVSVNTALYMDAEIRRDNKEAERKRSQSQEKEKKVRKPTLNTSKKMLIKRYLLEFDEIALKLGIGEEPDSAIHYAQYLSLLQHMGFIPEENEIEAERIRMIWNIVQDQNSTQDNGSYCRKHSLKVILAAI